MYVHSLTCSSILDATLCTVHCDCGALHSAALQFSETCERADELKLSVKHASAFYCTHYSAMSHKLCLNIIVHLMSPDENYTQCTSVFSTRVAWTSMCKQGFALGDTAVTGAIKHGKSCVVTLNLIGICQLCKLQDFNTSQQVSTLLGKK